MARRAALVLLVIYLLILLAVGLNPRDFGGNDVSWLADERGVRFDGHGLAVTDAPGSRVESPVEFTLLLELRLVRSPFRRGFEHVLTFFGNSTDSQLLVGQYEDSLIVTSGTDYDYRQRRPRLSARLSDGNERWHLVTVASGRAGSRLFVDGREVAAMPDALRLPANEGSVRLLLGNSVHGNQGWRGMIRHAVLIPQALDADLIGRFAAADREADWSDLLATTKPMLSFGFYEGQGRRSQDAGSWSVPVSFPRNRVVVAPEFFRPGLRDARPGDVLINLFGFVPLGFLCALALFGRARPGRAVTILVALGAGVMVSAGIETAQAWMPMRSSSSLDLLLNSFGTLIGALGCLPLARRVGPLSAAPTAQSGS